MSLTDKQTYFLLARLLMDGVPDATAKFYVRLYPLFQEFSEPVSAADIAPLMDTRPETVLRHFKKLEQFRYMERSHYRGWQIASERIEQHNKTLMEAQDG